MVVQMGDLNWYWKLVVMKLQYLNQIYLKPLLGAHQHRKFK